MVFEVAAFPLNFELDGAGFMRGDAEEDRIGVFTDDDGGGEGTRRRVG